jgi:hypothetical protein
VSFIFGFHDLGISYGQDATMRSEAKNTALFMVFPFCCHFSEKTTECRLPVSAKPVKAFRFFFTQAGEPDLPVLRFRQIGLVCW